MERVEGGEPETLHIFWLSNSAKPGLWWGAGFFLVGADLAIRLPPNPARRADARVPPVLQVGSQVFEKHPDVGDGFRRSEKVHRDESKAQGNECATEEGHLSRRVAVQSARLEGLETDFPEENRRHRPGRGWDFRFDNRNGQTHTVSNARGFDSGGHT
jgi:hypothetical protein